jgi:hypothetical protein
MEILGGLAVAGYILNNKKSNSSENNKKRNKIGGMKPNGENIFNSRSILNVDKSLKADARDRYQKSKNHMDTKIIPEFYNRLKETKVGQDDFEESFADSVFSDELSVGSDLMSRDSGYSRNSSIDRIKNNNGGRSNMDIINKCSKLSDNAHYENKIANNTKNSFLNQFEDMRFDNPGDPSSSNTVHQVHGKNNIVNKVENRKKLALDGGYSNFTDCGDMTYGIVDDKDFKHINMQPQFRPNKGYGLDPNREDHLRDTNKRRLDTFTGSLDNLDYRPKTERKPLFNPQVGLTNPYGIVGLTEFQEGRYQASKERRNEKPFQEVRVTPGVGLGANEVSKTGYHDTYRTMPKTVDELRAKNNPKKSYKQVIVPGMKGQRGPIQAQIYKRAPLTFKEYSTEDMIKGVGETRGPRIVGEFAPDNMTTYNRGAATNYVPAPKFFNEQAKPECLMTKTKVSLKENFEQAEPRNVGTQQYEKAYGFNKEGAIPDPTLRNIHEETDRRGFVGNSQHDQSYAFDHKTAVPDPNMRNIHAETDRRGFVGNSQHDQSYAFDHKTAVPDPNMRNVHNRSDRAGFVGNGQEGKNYAFDTKTNIPDPNMRNIHSKTDRAGFVGNRQDGKNYAFDTKTNIPDPNMRNIHSKTDRAGFVGNGQEGKNYAFDKKTNIPDPTMRDIHDKTDRAGTGVGTTQYKQTYAYDKKTNIPDPTMRDVHDETDRAGFVGTQQHEQTYAFDKKRNIPDPTMRDVHDKTDRAGFVGTQQHEKTYAWDYKTNIPDPTMRNIHDETDRAGFIGPTFKEKQTNRRDAHNMRVNIVKEKISQGRAPTYSNYSKGPILDYSMVHLCEPIQVNRELYPENKNLTTARMPTAYTRIPHTLPQTYWRTNKHVVENLEGNPYINNVIHSVGITN